MKEIINRILKIISSAIFVILIILVILILLYIVRVKFLASQGELGQVRTNFYTILTQSMHPSIKAGDVVITYKSDAKNYNKGDVITFVSQANGNITITHRINEVFTVNNEYSYQTKGDNNNAPDREIISSDDVLGKVILKIPKAGYIQQFMVSKFGWIVAIVLPCLGIIIYDIIKLFKVTARKSVTLIKKNQETEEARRRLREAIYDDSEEE